MPFARVRVLGAKVTNRAWKASFTSKSNPMKNMDEMTIHAFAEVALLKTLVNAINKSLPPEVRAEVVKNYRGEAEKVLKEYRERWGLDLPDIDQVLSKDKEG